MEENREAKSKKKRETEKCPKCGKDLKYISSWCKVF